MVSLPLLRRSAEMAKKPEERDLPPFKPPKPDLIHGLKNSFEVERELFTKNSFREALARTFVAAGQAPDGHKKFVVYRTHARGSIAAHLLPHGKPEESLGSLATMAGDADVGTYDEDGGRW